MLDYFLISKDLSPQVRKCQISVTSESDHLPISIHIQSATAAQKNAPGSGSLIPLFLKVKLTTLLIE